MHTLVKSQIVGSVSNLSLHSSYIPLHMLSYLFLREYPIPMIIFLTSYHLYSPVLIFDLLLHMGIVVKMETFEMVYVTMF